MEGIVEFGLIARDRLEPSTSLPDVGRFEELIPPCRVLFWRVSRETLCTHRCPLFTARIGITPADTISLDLLHTLFLGPMLIWCRTVIWILLLSTVWGVHERSDDEKVIVGLKCLKAEMQIWYETYDRQHPQDKSTRISTFTQKMIGTRGKPKCKVKAMECFYLMLFLLDLLGKYRIRIGASYEKLVDGGRALKDYVEMLKRASMNLSITELQVLATTSKGDVCRFK